MVHKRKPQVSAQAPERKQPEGRPPRVQQASRDEVEAEPEPEHPAAPIVQRPDGYYWQDDEEQQEFGPFESYELAEADRDAASEEALSPGAVLRESEQEIGIADWLDAETGEPAEGQSPPHLQEE